MISLSYLTFLVQASNIIIYPIKDSYVNSYEPEKNFGSQRNMECGTFYIPMTGLQQTEAYLYFDLNEISTDRSKVELYLDFYFVSEPVEFEIVSVVQEWEESLITWFNKPFQGETLLIFSVENDSEILIDISSFVSGNVLSICIDSPYFQDELVNITSREYDWEDYRPRLIINTIPSQINLLPVIIAIPFTIFSGSLMVWARKYKIKSCPKCGYENSAKGNYCYNCGAKSS